MNQLHTCQPLQREPFSASIKDQPKAPYLPPGGGIRILLVDDHAVVRGCLAAMLRMQAGLQVVGQAEDGIVALERARQLQPDVILMDVSMPRLDGIAATRQIVAESPGIRVIGLSMHDAPGVAAAMRKAGALAHVSKTADPKDIVNTIRSCGGATAIAV